MRHEGQGFVSPTESIDQPYQICVLTCWSISAIAITILVDWQRVNNKDRVRDGYPANGLISLKV